MPSQAYRRDRRALPLTRDYMLETERRYREIGGKPSSVKKPASTKRKNTLEKTDA